MATTQFCFTTVGATTPVAFSSSASFEVKTPTGTSSATTASANASQTICRVATDTAVYVTFGSSPTATSATGFMIPANAIEYFRVASGDKAAVITV